MFVSDETPMALPMKPRSGQAFSGSSVFSLPSIPLSPIIHKTNGSQLLAIFVVGFFTFVTIIDVEENEPIALIAV